jgi:chitin synthase
MDYNDSRPPRSRPPRPQSTQSRSMSQPPAPPPQIPNVTFQEPPRTRSIPDPRHQQGYNQPGQPPYSASYGNNPLPPTPNDGRDGEEGGFSDSGANFRRKKSLVRPDRERIDPTHRQWHYRTHAAQLETEGTGRVGTMPSSNHFCLNLSMTSLIAGKFSVATGNLPQNASGGLRRGKSLLAREQDVQESGLALFKRGATLRRKKTQEENPMSPNAPTGPDAGKRGIFRNIAPGPIDAWMIYCWLLTIWIPPFVLRACRIVTPEQQRAWREKMGLLALIGILMAGVGFLTFGFQQTVCGKPPQRYHSGTIDKASVIIHGYDYDFSHFNHPAVSGVFTGTTNPLYSGGYDVAGMDISFLFQNVNEHCQGIIKAANGSTITNTNGQVGWYFPCNEYNQFGTSQFNKTGYSSSTQCHIKSGTRALFDKTVHASGQVYYTWDDLQNPQRNLAVFESYVVPSFPFY